MRRRVEPVGRALRNRLGIRALSIQELAAACGLPEGEVDELVAYGALAPIIPDAAHWRFSDRCVRTLLRAVRLRRDLLLDFDAFALAVGLLGEIVALEDVLQAQRARDAAACGER